MVVICNHCVFDTQKVWLGDIDAAARAGGRCSGGGRRDVGAIDC